MQAASSSSLEVGAAPPVRWDAIDIALVCQSNINRSVEAHELLRRNGIACESFGVGSAVKLPGETQDTPNIYEFGTPYKEIYEDLAAKNRERYEKNRMIHMVLRDAKVKLCPQKWQTQKQYFNVVLTYDRRVYDIVVADILSRESLKSRPSHVINLETKDSHDGASSGAQHTLALVKKLYGSKDWEHEISGLLDQIEKDIGRPVVHSVQFY